MERRDRGLPEDVGNAGVAITRNPGVCLVWNTATFNTFRPPVGADFGVLFELGDPVSWSWWSCSRPATRAEVDESMASGLPLLEAECDKDPRPDAARRALARQYRAAERYLPATLAPVPA